MGHQENNHHRPVSVFDELSPIFLDNGISLTFSSDPAHITSSNLATYDALMMYGNLRSGPGSSNQPLVTVIRDYIREGGTLIGLHVASAAFRYDPRFSSLLGGRFQSHTVGRFTPETILPNHLLTRNLTPLDSFDETYILKDLNPDILVLQERVSGENRYPWTWVRSEGKGRVFYTASGHVPGGGSTTTYDAIIQPEFSELVLRATYWVTKRHFSSINIGGLMANGDITGSGSLLQPDLGCFWTTNLHTSQVLVAEGDDIDVGAENYTVVDSPEKTLIACPLGGGSQVFAQSIINQSGETLMGIWRASAANTVPILLEGLQIPDALPGTTLTSVNSTIGTGFVANRSGQLLARIGFGSGTPVSMKEGVFLSDQGIILEEGTSHPSLPPGVTFSNLFDGGLTLNSNSQLALVAGLSDGGVTLARKIEANMDLPVIQGEPVPDHPGVFWGEIKNLRISSNGQVVAAVSLTGDVNLENDTALIRILSTEPSGQIILQEGQKLDGAGSVGDLWNSNFVLNESGEALLVVGLTGNLVTPDQDQVLLRLSSAPEIVVREGDSLPAISATSTMGNWSDDPPISLGTDGSVYFQSHLLEGAETYATLFRAEKSTVFKVLQQGDTVELRKDATIEIASFEPLLSSGDDDGFPSGVLGQSLALSAVSATGHQVLLKLNELDDLDQDGLANLVEAGVGSSPNSPPSGQAHMPRIINISGALSYVFLRPTAKGLPLPTIEYSNNLATWISASNPLEIWPDQDNVPPGFQRVGIRVETGPDQLFYRLKF